MLLFAWCCLGACGLLWFCCGCLVGGCGFVVCVVVGW